MPEMSGISVEVRKKDTSSSTGDFWRNGAGDHAYHRHDEACDDAPTSGFVHYESSEISNPDHVDICPSCDWSGTELEQYVDLEGDDAE